MLRRSFVFALLVSFAAACGGDATGPGASATVTGTYSLKTVDGAALPYVMYQQGTEKVELMSASITLNSNGTFTDSYSFRETVGTAVTTDSETDSGTYTTSGGTVTFKYSDNSTGTMTWNGSNRLTHAEAGHIVVYEK